MTPSPHRMYYRCRYILRGRCNFSFPDPTGCNSSFPHSCFQTRVFLSLSSHFLTAARCHHRLSLLSPRFLTPLSLAPKGGGSEKSGSEKIALLTPSTPLLLSLSVSLSLSAYLLTAALLTAAETAAEPIFSLPAAVSGSEKTLL